MITLDITQKYFRNGSPRMLINL